MERDLCVVRELGLKLIYAMNTHVHADHVTGTGLIKVFLKSFVFDDDDAMWRYIVIDLGFFVCCRARFPGSNRSSLGQVNRKLIS